MGANGMTGARDKMGAEKTWELEERSELGER
jgi:hypothetical protein